MSRIICLFLQFHRHLRVSGSTSCGAYYAAVLLASWASCSWESISSSATTRVLWRISRQFRHLCHPHWWVLTGAEGFVVNTVLPPFHQRYSWVVIRHPTLFSPFICGVWRFWNWDSSSAARNLIISRFVASKRVEAGEEESWGAFPWVIIIIY